MQCRALDDQKFRCKNDATASDYCDSHRTDMERLIGENANASASRWRGMLAKLSASPNTVPDGGKYEVPKWLNSLTTPQVMTHLQTHSDSMVRWMAAFVLRKRRAAEALDALWYTRQNDPIRFVRQQAAVALGKIGAPAVYAPLVEGLHHDRDPGVREACAIALGNLVLPSNLGNAAVDELVHALAYEENVFVRWACIIALGQLGDARAENPLVRLQAEELAQVTRDACRDSLAEIRQRTRATRLPKFASAHARPQPPEPAPRRAQFSLLPEFTQPVHRFFTNRAYTTVRRIGRHIRMSKKILVVDDEKKLVQVLRGYLEQAGFAVVTAHDGKNALAAFRREKPTLVLLDLNLPEMDGLDVARAIRKQDNTPLIMVTARVEETDRLVGLELGADDYIVKPYSPREVVARVRAVLRRVGGENAPAEILRAGEIEMDLTRHEVTRDGETIDLTPTEFDLLAAFMKNPGRAFTRMQLLDLVQGEAFEGYERTIDAHIKNLRQKLGDDPKQPRYLHTVFGVGYKLQDA